MTSKEVQKTYSDTIALRTYCRFDEEKGRRETWEEAVNRYGDFLRPRVPDSLLSLYDEAIQAIHDRQIMPSMRLLWTAGEAAKADEVCQYNCSYAPIDNIVVFSEIMYLLMNGVGVGISVERQYINALPTVASEFTETSKIVTVEDSKKGWAIAYKELLEDWFNGIETKWDTSLVRPKGSPIKKFGGRASGPEVLVDLFNFTFNMVKQARGRKLVSSELADIACKVADIVICGGVRRSAIIIFSNLSDLRMREYKKGQFWETHKYRSLANISIAYTEEPDTLIFLEEMKALIESRTGERGIVNVENFPDSSIRYNPCGERALKPFQLCNLTEVVVGNDISFEELQRRVQLATLLGTIQASLTNFDEDVLRPIWKENTEEEALLGVSLTGTASRKWTSYELVELKTQAKYNNKFFAKELGINEAVGITCNKPSGTVSQLVGCSSGIHPAHAKYYIRRIRIASVDPICKLLMEQGVPCKPEVGETLDNVTTMVFEFPVQGNAIQFYENETALSQLENWKLFKTYWCDDRGNPSCTIHVKDHEWINVIAWVKDNWNIVGGISFLPYDGGVYQLTPYETVDKDTYNKLVDSFPTVDFTQLPNYEKTDATTGAKEYACSAGGCELV